MSKKTIFDFEDYEEIKECLENLTSSKYNKELIQALRRIEEDDEIYILTIYEREAIWSLMRMYEDKQDIINKIKDLNPSKEILELLGELE